MYKYQPISTKLGQNVYDHKISTMELIGPELSWVVCPWIRKFAIFDFVYSLESADMDQSVPNLATIDMPIRSLIILIMGQIEQEHLELFALEFGKIAEYDFLHSVVYKWVVCPWICKICGIWLYLHPSIYKCRVICLWIWKNSAFNFVYSLASTNINQSVPNLVTMYTSIRSQMRLIMGQVIPDQLVLSALEIEKLNFSSLSGIYFHC